MSTSVSIHTEVGKQQQFHAAYEDFTSCEVPFVSFKLMIGDSTVLIFLNPEQVEAFKDALTMAPTRLVQAELLARV